MILSTKEEKPFPRGGVAKKKKIENDNEAAQKKKFKDDDLFSIKAKTEIKSKKSKSTEGKKKGKKEGSSVKQGDDILTVKQLDTLSYEDLSEGFTTLACVSVVRDLELKLSLPGRLSATVPITQISKPYTDALKRVAAGDDDDAEVQPLADIFKVGQLVICTLTSVEKSEKDEFFYKVTASLAPHVVNSGKLDTNNIEGRKIFAAVKSVEDYGYVMDIGLPSVQAFLPKKKTEKYSKEFLDGRPPSIGQIIPCVVTQVNGQAAKLSADPGKLRSILSKASDVNIHTLLPGMMFEASVDDKRVKNGVKLNFGEFSGYAHFHHLEKEPDAYDPEEKVTATVLYILPTINAVYLSTKGHVKLGSKIGDLFSKFSIGSLASDVKISDVSPKGITVKLDEEVDGFVPLRSVSDSNVSFQEVKKDFTKGSVKPCCRIFQYDYLDRHFICSFQKSMIKSMKSTVTAETLRPGEKVKCTVKSFLHQGVLVEVGKKRQEAFIPSLHLTDIPLSHPEKKFSPGDSLKCRVLKVDPNKNKIHLTTKPILVNRDDYEIVDSFDESQVGKVTEGVVVKLSPSGLLLQLFGDAKGWVPKSKISTEVVDHPEKFFFLGQALKCKVLSTDKDSQRMTLSLILTDEKLKPLGQKEKEASEHLQLGDMYSCTVESIAADGLNVFAVHIKKDGESSEDLKPVKCFIPAMHLTDHPVVANSLLNSFKVGDVIPEVVCFEKGALPIMSLKPSILQFAKTEPARSFDELHQGLVLPCVVNLAKPFGIFVRMPTWKFRKSGMVPTRLLADHYVENPRDFVQVYQTIYAKIVETDSEKQTVTMTTKLKELPRTDTCHRVEMLRTLFEDFEKLRKNMNHREGLLKLTLGTPVTCKVTEISEYGIETEVEGVRGIIPRAALGEEEYDVGDEIAAVVVFVDYQFSCVELSPDPDFVKQAVKAIGKPPPGEGERVKARVVVTRSSPFFFVTLRVQHPHKYTGQLVHVPTRYNLNDQNGHTDQFSLGEVHNLVIKYSCAEFVLGVLERHEKSANKRKRRDSVEALPAKHAKKESELNETKDISSLPDATSPKKDEEVPTIEVDVKVEDPGWAKEYDPWGVGLDGGAEAQAGGSEGAGDDQSSTKKAKTHLSKKEKKELDRLEAEEIARAEQRVLDGEVAEPETVEEFDRLVLASPNSSLCWIKYMAFYIAKSQHDNAREIARRALEKIHFREEAERLNVYLAWFNMENSCGNEEQAEKVFKEALKCNDQYSVYQRVASSYSQNSNQHDKAEKIYKIMARRFCKEIEVWVQLGNFYFHIGNLKDARFTLQRGLQNLEPKYHVDLSSRFAQMEFKVGEAERGKTIFENIVSNYPKRTDQWNVYVDMVIKRGEFDTAREIFERMIQLNLQPKKMKNFFKKYLEFEQTHGDQHRVDVVRKKALEYVETKFGVTDVDPVEHLDAVVDHN